MASPQPTRSIATCLIAPTLLALLPAQIGLAQSITPADDGTGTAVTPTGAQYDITGGTVSGDGTNLFHSFGAFGLTPAETANFIANPSIQNILGRVTGGNASVIDGLIQVSGSAANLFLMNPAGILFGPNAALNLDGSFTATTATGIGFGQAWFNGIGSSDYAALVGDPTSFAFAINQPAPVVNAGNLAVDAGQSLTLTGGSVVNTGTLTTPGGQITIQAVPGENLVRISQAGSLLSLELATLPTAVEAAPTLTPLDLPTLLTGPVGAASGLAVQPDGTVKVAGSDVAIPTAGSAIASGTLNVSGETGGSIYVLGDRTAVLNGSLEASGTQGGGTVYIGGAYQGGNTLPAATVTLVDGPSQIRADGGLSGHGGKVILWANGTTAFYGDISAQGGAEAGNGGFVEVSGAKTLVFRGDVDTTAANGDVGTLLLDPENIRVADGGGALNDDQIGDGKILVSEGTPTDTFTISEAALEGLSKQTVVQLAATNDITIEDLTDNQLTFADGPGGSITFTADADNSGVGDFRMTPNDDIIARGRDLVISGASLTLGALNTEATVESDQGGGAIALTATQGDITARDIDSDGGNGPGGAVTLKAAQGSITVVQDIDADSALSDGGRVIITAGKDVTIGQIKAAPDTASLGIDTESDGGNGKGGDIAVTAGGNVNIFELDADSTGATQKTGGGGNIVVQSGGRIFIEDAIDSDAATGDGGDITLTAGGDLTVLGNNSTATVESFSSNGSGGDITFTAAQGNIFIDGQIVSESVAGGSGGNITLSAGGKVSATSFFTTLDATGAETGGSITVSGQSLELGSLDAKGGEEGGAIALTGNEIDFDGDITSNGGPLVLQPLAPGHSVVVGGTLDLDPDGNRSQTLDITASELAFLKDGFSTIAIGRPDSSIVATGNLAFQDPVAFLSPVTLGDSVVFGNGTDAIAFNNTLNIGSRDITVNATSITASSILGTSGSSITLQGPTIVLGSATFQADEMDFGGALFSDDGTLTLLPATAGLGITLGGTTIDGRLNLSDQDLANITQKDPMGLMSGFSQITIGSQANTGPIDIAGTFNTNGNNLSLAGQSITSSGGSLITGGGNLSLTANQVALAPLSISTENLSDLGGNIEIRADDITVGDLSSLGFARSGDIRLIAVNTITAGNIKTSSLSGNAGDVLLDPIGDIQVASINAQGGPSGVGGDVTIATQRFFRATASFIDQLGQPASISTAGGLGGGTIRITHGGGLVTPFAIGNASRNGTLSAITSGGFRLAFDSPGNPFFGRFNVGGPGPGSISLITSDRTVDPCDAECDLSGSSRFSIPVTSRQEVIAAIDDSVLTALPTVDAAVAIASLETAFSAEYASYFDLPNPPETLSLADIQETLSTVQSQLKQANTQQVPALLFVAFGLPPEAATTPEATGLDNYRLELILVTASGEPIYRQIPNASRRQVLDLTERLRRQVTDPNLVNTTTYLTAAEQLYHWIIAPIQSDLAELGVTNIGFVMDAGLRSLPIAALYDGQHFLVENYSLGLIPSMSLIDKSYVNIQNADMLIGGASQFATQSPLLSAPVEIAEIQSIWPGAALVEQDFTRTRLQEQRQQEPYQIIHLVTHGEFLRGTAANSYLQFFDNRLRLSQLDQLGWATPRVELVTLSACETAIGNREAELGFAGFAVGSGAKSALASLWKVSDEATTGLMVEFYRELRESPIKAEALRQAQLALLSGQVYAQDDQIVWGTKGQVLPPALQWDGRRSFAHPFYWAAFTLVGSPW